MAILSAHVVLESGEDFIARMANLTPSTVFIETSQPLPFRSRVRVTFFSVSVVGVVVHASADPPGIIVALDGATPEMRVMIEESMEEVPVVWPDPKRSFDRQPTLEHILPPAITEPHAFEEPTRTGDENDPDDPLSTPVAIPEVSDGPRLRATTVVGDPNAEDFVEEPTEDGIPS